MNSFRLALCAVFLATLIFAVSPAQAQRGPVIDFAGHSYILLRTDVDAFEGAAFDPIDRYLVSMKVTDICGNEIDPDVSVTNGGGAWDPINDTFWGLKADDRVVFEWNAGNADTVFLLPETFTVPGVGPDTLESPRGIALDSNYVYIVDAGPNPTAIESNAWFKFQRDGTPVSSSKITDFTAHMEARPDALVDGIAWVPPGSVVTPGLFLVAMEHSGIYVIDSDGFFVDALYWEDYNLPQGTKPSAFAGITVDPDRGDIYMANNDRTDFMLMRRLPDPNDGVLYGAGPSNVWVHMPDTLCHTKLYTDYVGAFETSPLLFGLTYRSADSLLWSIDFNTSDIYTIHPFNGKATQVTTLGLFDVWGMAYDTQRDVIYISQYVGASNGQHQIHVLDPVALTHTTLPNPVFDPMAAFQGPFNDIAFNPYDNHIYAVVNFGGAAFLVSIDRDTGMAGPPIGLTESTSGLAFNQATGKLMGTHNGAQFIWSIDPSTGVATLEPDYPSQPGWEGLAWFPSGDVGTAVLDRPARPAPLSRIAAFPNPFRDAIHFAGEPGALRDIRIYDVRGREVQRLRAARGATTLLWDGRGRRGRPLASGVYFVRSMSLPGALPTRVTIIR